MSEIIIDDQTMTKLIHSSLELLNQYGYFTQCMWHVNDIHLLCEQKHWPALTHMEARSVFDIFAELFEGDQGLTWSKLEQATQVFLAQQGKIKGITHTRSLSADAIEQLAEDEAHDDSKQRELASEKYFRHLMKERERE